MLPATKFEPKGSPRMFNAEGCKAIGSNEEQKYMKTHPISKRLKKIASVVKKGTTLADIGTDHGYLPHFLMERQLIDAAIMCDVNQGPLDNAQKTFADWPVPGRVAFRLGSGLEPVENAEVGTVVIAGMGGGLVKRLLSNDIDKTQSFKTLILQPQTEQEDLRDYVLNELRRPIAYDVYVEDADKQYELFVVSDEAVDTVETYAVSGDLEFGYKIRTIDSAAYSAFLAHKKRKYTLIQERLPFKEETLEKRTVCTEKLKTIEKLEEVLRHADNC